LQNNESQITSLKREESKSPENKKQYILSNTLVSYPSHATITKEIKKIAENKHEKDALKRMNTMPNDPMPTLCYGKHDR
jgi:hypothetical protein